MGDSRPAPTAAADSRCHQAPPASGEPGAALAFGLRRPPLDRLGDPGRARRSGREPADRSNPPARQLPPGVPARWGSKTYYTQLRIDPLPSESAEELLDALLGADTGLEPLKRLLIDRTEGNPFFLEESVRTLVETKALVGERGAYRLAAPVEGIQVPATVQAILAARIDRLPPEEKRLVQTAAVIGKDVPFAAPPRHRGLARGGAPPGPRPPSGRRVPLRNVSVSGPRIHLQARPDP